MSPAASSVAVRIRQQRQPLALPGRHAQVLQHVLERMRCGAAGQGDAFAAAPGARRSRGVEPSRPSQLQRSRRRRQRQGCRAIPLHRQSRAARGGSRSGMQQVAPRADARAVPVEPGVGIARGLQHFGLDPRDAIARQRRQAQRPRSSAAARARGGRAAGPASAGATGSADPPCAPGKRVRDRPVLEQRRPPRRTGRRPRASAASACGQRSRSSGSTRVAQEIAVEARCRRCWGRRSTQPVRLGVGEQAPRGQCRAAAATAGLGERTPAPHGRQPVRRRSRAARAAGRSRPGRRGGARGRATSPRRSVRREGGMARRPRRALPGPMRRCRGHVDAHDAQRHLSAAQRARNAPPRRRPGMQAVVDMEGAQAARARIRASRQARAAATVESSPPLKPTQTGPSGQSVSSSNGAGEGGMAQMVPRGKGRLIERRTLAADSTSDPSCLSAPARAATPKGHRPPRPAPPSRRTGTPRGRPASRPESSRPRAASGGRHARISASGAGCRQRRPTRPRHAPGRRLRLALARGPSCHRAVRRLEQAGQRQESSWPTGPARSARRSCWHPATPTTPAAGHRWRRPSRWRRTSGQQYHHAASYAP